MFFTIFKIQIHWSFRLTKWNVNVVAPISAELFNLSFRLTKWNVNNAEKFESWVFDEGFRLTKWNVNLNEILIQFAY